MLLEEGIVKIKGENEEPFTLKSGKKSRLFIDIKEACSNPTILTEIVYSIREQLTILGNTKSLKFNLIGSVAVGGISIGSVLLFIYLYDWYLLYPHIIVRTEKNDRGTQTKIIGDCKGKTVVLIEDVATSGGSIIDAVQAIRDAGGICDDVIVVVDREEGAKERCDKVGLNLISVLKKSDFGIRDI